MKAEDTVNRIRGALADHLSDYEQKSENRVYIEIPPEVVIEAAQLLFEEVGARLQIATGLDTGQGIEVMYHWALDEEDCLVTVRVTVCDPASSATPIEARLRSLASVGMPLASSEAQVPAGSAKTDGSASQRKPRYSLKPAS